MASIDSIPEELQNKIIIPLADHPDSFFLGPMGNPDPTEDLTELTPPQIAYQKWCPNLRLGWNAPSLQAVMKRKATDPLDDQPIISLVQKGADSSKRAVKKVRVSKPQPKDTPTPGADENQLKSLADAAVTEVIYDINTEEENPDALDPIDDLLLSDEENTRVDLTKSPELILGD